MYTNYKVQLDQKFQAEVRDDKLILNIASAEVSNETLSKLEEFCDSLDLEKSTRQIIFDDTLSLVEDITFIQALKSRIE